MTDTDTFLVWLFLACCFVILIEWVNDVTRSKNPKSNRRDPFDPTMCVVCHGCGKVLVYSGDKMTGLQKCTDCDGTGKV